jgi:chromosome segregation ATPase
MDKKFIEQAKSIRREYAKVIKEISSSEEKIEVYRNELKTIEVELKSVTSQGNIDQDKLRSRMMDMERNMKSIEEIITPYDKKVKQLEKDADKLFENIKERYPNITKEEIQQELIPHLAEIKFQ